MDVIGAVNRHIWVYNSQTAERAEKNNKRAVDKHKKTAVQNVRSIKISFTETQWYCGGLLLKGSFLYVSLIAAQR